MLTQEAYTFQRPRTGFSTYRATAKCHVNTTIKTYPYNYKGKKMLETWFSPFRDECSTPEEKNRHAKTQSPSGIIFFYPRKNAFHKIGHTNGNPKPGTQKIPRNACGKIRNPFPGVLSQRLSKLCPGGHLPTAPARPVRRRRPCVCRGHLEQLRGTGVGQLRGHGGTGGARESQ